LGPLLRKPLQQSSALACFDVEDNRPQVAGKIPEAKSALEGERKHITVLFAGPAGLISPCGWVFGYEPLRKGRHEQLEEPRTGDSRPLPVHLMAQIVRELDRLEVVLEQLKTVEAERNALLKPATGAAGSPPATEPAASALSLWFHERVRRLGGRMRKTTVIALAR
jgi:hypothetical protein